MRAKVTFNRQALFRISKGQARALAMTAQQMLNETRNDQVFPFDTGNLQNDTTFVEDRKAAKGEVQIVSDAPYARRVYYGVDINFHKDKNANAQAHWWEEWLTGDKVKRPHQLFAKFLRMFAGGYVR